MADAKAAKKEGGKKGVDISGMSDMGGVKFFNVTLESANGDLELASVALEGMNAPVDEAAEERKGGAGHLGKMLLSAGDKTVALVCNIPKELGESYPHVKAADWVEKLIQAAGGKVAKREESDEVIKVLIEGDTENGLFPLKMRDAASSAGFAFLRENGLLPADDSDDDYIPDPEAAGIEW
ncbi:hypothetical protein VOLCADRAFT_105818 [Volvox carteri f. nagariensis]|uniref:Uncharacterized protein n=1 Tax=Volvox carteri f. nagariensis TaxID=3068 RepID=D8U3B7_VOLCA|nr:uncharacterized protein VOLCADRAFT_105818 [Volvox carteri f. nagariensis]EFJ45725.1 hypothetical protein VOLCADRAFT_105818 [Volvox carteri f. nagariensis]|eukprot:XP_002953126.1 hypothetical protein VOLCADRAFT_105818 [Volvox carteri f. nagariensis]